MKLTTLFYFNNLTEMRKTFNCFSKYIENNNNSKLDTFQNSAYVIIYLQTKAFA